MLRFNLTTTVIGAIDGGESKIYPGTFVDIDGNGVIDSGKTMDLNGDGIIEME